MQVAIFQYSKELLLITFTRKQVNKVQTPPCSSKSSFYLLRTKQNKTKRSVTTSDFTQMGKTDDKWPRPMTAVQGTDYSEKRKEFKHVFEAIK